MVTLGPRWNASIGIEIVSAEIMPVGIVPVGIMSLGIVPVGTVSAAGVLCSLDSSCHSPTVWVQTNGNDFSDLTDCVDRIWPTLEGRHRIKMLDGLKGFGVREKKGPDPGSEMLDGRWAKKRGGCVPRLDRIVSGTGGVG